MRTIQMFLMLLMLDIANILIVVVILGLIYKLRKLINGVLVGH